MTSASSYWTANEFYGNLKAYETSGNLDLIGQTLQQQIAYRNPTIVALCPELYRLPITSLAWLYRAHPNEYRQWLLSGAGAPHSAGIWSRLATLANLAAGQRDFVLLGRIALECEFATQIERVTPGDSLGKEVHQLAKLPEITDAESLSNDTSRGANSSLLSAFLSMFDLEQHAISLPDYCDAVVGYLSGLPASFIVPCDLIFPECQPGSAAKQNWRLLRRFWTSDLAYLPNFPEKLAILSAAPNPQVAEWAGRVGQMIPLAPPAIVLPIATPAGPATPVSPFAQLAVEVPNYVPAPLPTVAPVRRRKTGFLSWLWDALFGFFR